MMGSKNAYFSMNLPIELFNGFKIVPNMEIKEVIKQIRYKVFYTFIYIYV